MQSALDFPTNNEYTSAEIWNKQMKGNKKVFFNNTDIIENHPGIFQMLDFSLFLQILNVTHNMGKKHIYKKNKIFFKNWTGIFKRVIMLVNTTEPVYETTAVLIIL